jgi:hypothetical protein
MIKLHEAKINYLADVQGLKDLLYLAKDKGVQVLCTPIHPNTEIREGEEITWDWDWDIDLIVPLDKFGEVKEEADKFKRAG